MSSITGREKMPIYRAVIGIDLKGSVYYKSVKAFQLQEKNKDHIGIDVILGYDVISNFYSACIEEYGKILKVSIKDS